MPHPLPPLTHLLATWQLPSHSTITDLLLSFIHLTQTQYAAPPGDHNHSWWCLSLTSWKQLLSLRVVTHEVLHHSSANRRHLKIGTTSLQCVHFPKWICPLHGAQTRSDVRVETSDKKKPRNLMFLQSVFCRTLCLILLLQTQMVDDMVTCRTCITAALLKKEGQTKKKV